MKTKIGRIGEEIAKQYFDNQNYKFITQNYYYNHGEIDLIYKEGDELVFIEVKFRKSDDFGDPLESITPKKQKLIRRTAEGYVIEKNIINTPCRFDVITIVGSKKNHKINHLKNSF